MTVIRKPKKCKVCPAEFIPTNSLQKACSVVCAMAIGREAAAKVERKLLRDRRATLRTRSDWMKLAQIAYNAYIRERDKDLPCISCGDFTPMTRGGDYDCGHYRSVGANPELRFEELNAHKQCKRCNSHLSGNVVNYRIGLLLRIGEERVKWLEGPHAAKKYTIEDLKAIRAEYNGKRKELKTKPVYPI